MDPQDPLRTLLVVVEAGSFSAAARRLRVTPAAVGKQIARLEERLGARLLHRTTRSQQLTDVGRRYVERCRPLVAEIDAVARQIREEADDLVGTLSITSPVFFGRERVVPVALAFMERWPRTRLDLHLTDTWVDLARTGTDLAVRMARSLPDSSLVGKRIGTYTSTLAASPAYLSRTGTPERPEDLRDRDGLMLRTRQPELAWTFTPDLLVGPRVRLLCDDFQPILDATRRGLGIAALPTLFVQEELQQGSLIPLFEERFQLERDIWLLRPPDRGPVLRLVEAFEEALREALQIAVR